MQLSIATTYLRPFPGDDKRLPEAHLKYVWGEGLPIVAGVDALGIRSFVDSVTIEFDGDPYKTKARFRGNILVTDVSLNFPFTGEFILYEEKMPKPGELAKHIVAVIQFRYAAVRSEIGQAFSNMPTVPAIADPC